MSDTNNTQDKLNWNNINQLHDAISNFSKQSFDIKKLWITIEVSIVTLLLTMKVSEKTILFAIGAVLLFFYFLDSMTYYYQDKLRKHMTDEQNEIRKRNHLKEMEFRGKGRVFRSLFNWSHLLYYVVLLFVIVLYFIC